MLNLLAGQPMHRRAGAGARRGRAAARRGRPARLHAGDRDPRAARGDRRPPPAARTASTSTADEVVVTTGSSGGFLLAFLAAFEVGDRVAMARPGYPCYRNVLTALGCEVVEIPTGPETRFQPTVEQVAAARRAHLKGLVVASPANPTGTMLLPSELRRARGVVRGAPGPADLRRDLPRHRVRARRPRPSPAAPGRPAARRSSSPASRKYFSMTGWRIGWMLVPERLRRAVDVLTGNFTICPPVIAQRACLAAFSDASYDELDGHVRALRRQPRPAARAACPGSASPSWRRPTARSTCTPTSATSPTTRWPSPTTCWRAPASPSRPGSTSTPWTGSRFIRLSFAGPGSEIEEALDRLSTAL